jgi:uncharacterized protein YkwD
MPFARQICAALLVFLAAVGLVQAATAAPQATKLTQSERSLLAAVNNVRAAHRLRRLTVDPALQRVARSYSATMIRTGRFTHGDMGRRVGGSGARGPAYGENLAWGTGSYASARTIVANWMRSPSHRANMLRAGWTRIGIGAVNGTFMGRRGATVVTADFAGR